MSPPANSSPASMIDLPRNPRRYGRLSFQSYLTIAVIVFTGITVVRADDGDPQEDNRLGPRVKLLDSDGRALKDAWVGVGAHGESEKTPSWSPYSPHGTSMDDGVAGLVGRPLQEGKVVLYARHEGRNLCGIQSFDREQLTAGAEMKLHPACRVHGALQSSTLKAAGQKLGWTNVYLYEGRSRPLSFSSKENRFEFHLPPGKYRLNAYGTGTEQVDREIEVKPNQRELAIDAVDLPATRLATLIGKPALDLQEIREWSNSPPMRLKDLQGKYVLLTFWGHWCGPCLREIPHLMKLHDAFGDRGLVVLSVHDTSVESIAEMDRRLEAAREREWWGRDIPFLPENNSLHNHALWGCFRNRCSQSDLKIPRPSRCPARDQLSSELRGWWLTAKSIWRGKETSVRAGEASVR